MVDPSSGYTVTDMGVRIERADVERFQGPGPYTCQCRAYYQGEGDDKDWQYVGAEESVVRIACEKD